MSQKELLAVLGLSLDTLCCIGEPEKGMTCGRFTGFGLNEGQRWNGDNMIERGCLMLIGEAVLFKFAGVLG